MTLSWLDMNAGHRAHSHNVCTAVFTAGLRGGAVGCGETRRHREDARGRRFLSRVELLAAPCARDAGFRASLSDLLLFA